METDFLGRAQDERGAGGREYTRDRPRVSPGEKGWRMGGEGIGMGGEHCVK